MEGILPFLSDDVVAYPNPEWPTDSIYRGKEGFRQLAAEFTGHFIDYSWEEQRTTAFGENLVVGFVYHHGRITGSAIPVTQPMGAVWRVKDGKCIEVHFFLSWKEARDAAADLPE